MTTFLDEVGAGFTSLGVHPVLGAFVVGVLLVVALRSRRLPLAATVGVAADDGARGTLQKTLVRMGRATASVSVDGRTVQLDAGVMAELAARIRDGKKIEAIKLVREKTGLGLAEAKHLVEALEASPMV